MYGRFACLYTTTVGKFWRRASVFTQLEIEWKVREGFTKFILSRVDSVVGVL